MKALVLCAGEGQRLRPLTSDRPKPMAEINGYPFLDILINYVSSFGARRFILCAGHQSSYIADYYAKAANPWDLVISEEKNPLGTGGAVKNAEKFIKSDPFLVMNGDCFCPVDLGNFLSFHKNKKAFLSIVVAQSKDSKDFGSVVLDNSERVINFSEKANKGRALVNAGIYLFEEKALSMIPANKKYSLEYDLFPKAIDRNCYGLRTNEELIDIGTPERYEYAKSFFRK